MQRRKFLELSLGSGLATVGTSVGSSAKTAARAGRLASPPHSGSHEEHPALEISSDSQIFVDDLLIEHLERVWRSVSHPDKFTGNPIMKADRPWEGYLILQPGTVLYDKREGKFKMWYLAAPSQDRVPPIDGDWSSSFLCYATSQDGVTWEKPDLGLVEFRGAKANNILLTQVNWDHSLVEDEDEPDPSKRYKLLYWQTWKKQNCGIWSAFSADGIHWHNPIRYPSVPCSATGDTFSVLRDLDSKRYLLFHKTVLGPIRKISCLASDDFVSWQDDLQMLQPDDLDQPDTEFYGVSAFPYAGQYIGMLWVFHTYLQIMDTQLVSSRDGLHWQRALNRKIFIPLGYMVNGYDKESFDSKMIWPASAPVQKEDKLWIYYSGFANTHNAVESEHTGQIGLAHLRLDGFCSLDATSEGFVITRALKFQGSHLFVNAEVNAIELQSSGSHPAWAKIFAGAGPEGYVRVEILDELGRPIEGYTASECAPLRGDGVKQQVSWSGGKGLDALRGRAVKLKFIFANTKLYAFRIQ